MQSMAARRMRTGVLVLIVVYVAVFLGADFAVLRLHPAGWALWGYAAVPLLPIVGMFVQFGLWLGAEQDGYKRELAVRCVLWGTAGAMTVHFFEGLLRIFQWRGELPPFAELGAFAICALVAKFSYRAANRVAAEA